MAPCHYTFGTVLHIYFHRKRYTVLVLTRGQSMSREWHPGLHESPSQLRVPSSYAGYWTGQTVSQYQVAVLIFGFIFAALATQIPKQLLTLVF